LHAALSGNGSRVHLAHADGTPVCGAAVLARYRVRARITCSTCLRKRPKKAMRLAGRPVVVGVDHSPRYAAIARALRAGATVEPSIKVKYWPVLETGKSA